MGLGMVISLAGSELHAGTISHNFFSSLPALYPGTYLHIESS
jgi:hypothetical protein